MRSAYCTVAARIALLLLVVTSADASFSRASPRRGEMGYKRAFVRRAVTRVFRPLPADDEFQQPLPSNLEGSPAALAKLEVAPATNAATVEDDCVPVEADCLPICEPDELQQLQTLRTLVSVPSPAHERADVYGDVRLLRFLRKHSTPAAASERYKEMLTWRTETRLDTDALTYGQPVCEIASHEVLFRYMPVETAVSWAGGDSEAARGDAVMCMQLGGWDTHGLVDAVSAGTVTEEQFEQYWARVNELVQLSLDAASRRHGRLAGMTLICDFRGTSWRQFSRPFLGLMKRWAQLSEFYPSTSTEILFLHAPSFFSCSGSSFSPSSRTTRGARSGSPSRWRQRPCCSRTRCSTSTRPTWKGCER